MIRQFVLSILGVGTLLMSVSAVFAQQVVVTPEETDEILANPGMGWETFHHTSKQDKSLPPWIPSTVHYARWGWGELEPQPGKLNTEFLDKVLKETHDSGQKLAFRVMCCSTLRNAPYHPKWLKDVGGKELIAEYGMAPFPIPDMDDPVVLKAHLDFIKRLGREVRRTPRHRPHRPWLHWLVGGMAPERDRTRIRMPTLENRMKVVDAYLAAFKKTPLADAGRRRRLPEICLRPRHGLACRLPW